MQFCRREDCKTRAGNRRCNRVVFLSKRRSKWERFSRFILVSHLSHARRFARTKTYQYVCVSRLFFSVLEEEMEYYSSTSHAAMNEACRAYKIKLLHYLLSVSYSVWQPLITNSCWTIASPSVSLIKALLILICLMNPSYLSFHMQIYMFFSLTIVKILFILFFCHLKCRIKLLCESLCFSLNSRSRWEEFYRYWRIICLAFELCLLWLSYKYNISVI